MRKWLPLIAVCLGTFMLLVDVTIVNVALPDMTLDLRASFGSLQWVVDGYALTLAALLLGVGGVADRIGHRRAYLIGLVIFALASLSCGLAPNPTVLIASRVVQGLGGAAMIATCFALLNAAYEGKDRGTAYGVWGAVSGASSAVGPLLGGPLTQGLSWRWIFFVNLPVSAVAIVTGLVWLRDPPIRATRRIDAAGVALFSAAIGALTFGMIRAADHGWSGPWSWGSIATGAVLLATFGLVEARRRDPLLAPALLRNRVFGGVLIAALLLNVAAYVSLAYTSIWVQSVLQLSPITAGLVALPMSGAAFVASAALGPRMHRLRAGHLIAGGLLLVGLGDLLGVALVAVWPSWPALLPGYLVLGVGIGIATPPLSSTGTAAVPPERGGMAGGAIYTARQVGFAFGIALLGGVFTAGAQHGLRGDGVPGSGALARTIAGGRSAEALASAPVEARAALGRAVRGAAADGIVALLGVAGMVGVVGAIVVFLLLRHPASSSSTTSTASMHGHPSRPDDARRTAISGQAG